jgi:hypothetical protein
MWSNKSIKISELKRLIYQKVTEATNRLQKPTTRSENIDWDWELKSK